jgi:hypothetical protein
MFGRDHHQKEEISGTDPFEALTDLNMGAALLERHEVL